MAIDVGAKMPSVSFMIMGPEGPKTVPSEALFSGKRVALFGLPGAYTPVCSAAHLPGFVEHAEALRNKGIDSIACVSVNDPFVMDAWGKDNNAGDSVMMLSDPDGAFTRAIGLSLDLSGFGLGKRSERYAMIVDDGEVKTINVEESVLDHGITSAESLLSQA